MAVAANSLVELRAALAEGRATPESVVDTVLTRANSNQGKNVFLSFKPERAWDDARAAQARFRNVPKPLLYGLPISLKDCFDLAGSPTTCGSRYYEEQNPPAKHDSAMALRLRAQGATIVGKTHLNQLAYGITGENPDYGDCLQPGSETHLTGGSSSGAAASVLEGSAYAGVGTDTGGSLRVPAALCGLASYRASLHLSRRLGLWHGCVPFAPSFDTLGWIFQDLRDAPFLAEAILGLNPPTKAETRVRIAIASSGFLNDCDPAVLAAYSDWQSRLRSLGATLVPCDLDYWNDAVSIFAPIQALEAASAHGARTGGDYSHFEPAIAEKLIWGASIRAAELEYFRRQHKNFRARVDALLHEFEYLLLPCCPVSKLLAGADHKETRLRIFRYTTPLSLAGVPIATLPAKSGAGMQLAAARGGDLRLLSFAAEIGKQFTEQRGAN